jgi:hypothetical protein
VRIPTVHTTGNPTFDMPPGYVMARYRSSISPETLIATRWGGRVAATMNPVIPP